MKIYFPFLLFLSISIPAGFCQTMIADIQDPVVTGFGTYYPYPVTVKPNATSCDPGSDLEKVINLHNFAFTENDLTLLKKNHFVVTPALRASIVDKETGYNEIYDVYNECRENGIPIFVTSDAMLHTFHLCFDYILRTCEEKRFIGQLNDLLRGLYDETILQLQSAQNETVDQALSTNLNFLIVALKLLDPTFVEAINGGPYLEELSLIEAAQSEVDSPIFHYQEDYTQYIVRGHYTRSDSLRHYFKSMMWLGRMTFSCESVDDPFSREATRSALLLLQTMSKVQINGRDASETWDDIYQPTVFFVGKSDDIGYYEFLPLAQDVYGSGFSQLPADTFADEALLTAFLQKTTALPEASITYGDQPSKGFRFMGQRFIPDSWIMDELVELKTIGRIWPTGLDVMMVLGSEQAFQYLPDVDKNNPDYITNLNKLKEIFRKYPGEIWAQNAYWNWLYCLMPLLSVKGVGYPYFMQTAAWVDKDLFAALASWAELRHDTILYAKQSGTETGMPPSAVEIQGYVEPNPHLYGRLASLSEFMMQGLDSRGLLFENFEKSLQTLADLCKKLKNISEKELLNLPLSSEEYGTIFDIGKTLYDIVTFSRYPSGGPSPWSEEDGLDPMPVIADVHTDLNSHQVLEEGVGYPYAIFVVCNIEGRPVIAKGAGFSYFEFTWPAADRLTDEKWREMLKSTTPPTMPGWTESFISGADRNNENPQFFHWRKPNSLAMNVSVEPENPKVGDDVTVVITINQWFSEYGSGILPDVWVTTPDGIKYKVENITSGANPNNSWNAHIATTGMSKGRVFVDISKFLETYLLTYRTSFDLESAQAVAPEVVHPHGFVLYQNQPNPFNPATTIRFDLPRMSDVSLDIYNISGHHVRQLLYGSLNAGSHHAVWDGRDQLNRAMGSGIYYYKLQVGDFADVKRMLLLK